MEHGLVSVIIPCFNYGIYLNDALKSIQNQSYKKIEIIVVDDASTDEFTLYCLHKISREGITVINSSRIYPAAARNLGVQNSKGEFILTLDADDLFESTFVEKSVKILNQLPMIGAVSCWTLGFGFKDFLWKPRGGNIANFLTNINCSMSALIRAQAWAEINGMDESYKFGYEDWEFWIRFTKKGWIIHIIPEILFYYRQKKDSRVHETNKLHKIIYYDIIKKHADVFKSLYPDTFRYLND